MLIMFVNLAAIGLILKGAPDWWPVALLNGGCALWSIAAAHAERTGGSR